LWVGINIALTFVTLVGVLVLFWLMQTRP
jgi:hypothetical protein